MGKTRVEVCLISARGLQRWSSLWKLQWFAVGWIDPKNKYCTNIDTSGSTNPTWRTKFSVLSDDDSESMWQSLGLHIEVYSRDSIFLREKLQGTAVVALKEFFLLKKKSNTTGAEQVGSFQLRKKNGGKAQGFIDVSIRIISEEEKGDHNVISSYSYPGNGEGFQLTGEENAISFQPQPQPQMNLGYDPHRPPYPANYYANPSSSVGGPNYGPPPPRQHTPPPPPPPSHVGYLPTFLPTATSSQMPGTFVNTSSSSAGTAAAGGRSGMPANVGMGMGAGALVAGAVIFGDDFMSGFEIPSTLRDYDETLVISSDSPF